MHVEWRARATAASESLSNRALPPPARANPNPFQTAVHDYEVKNVSAHDLLFSF